MPKYPEIRIEPPKKGTSSNLWGEFIYGPKMPWGPWQLTREPQELFRFKNTTVFECFADEYVEDEQGYVTHGTTGHDPCFRHFLVGRSVDGNVLWWHNLNEQRYDFKNKKFHEATIRIEGREIVISGYGWEVEPNVEIHIDVETGAKAPIEVGK